MSLLSKLGVENINCVSLYYNGFPFLGKLDKIGFVQDR